MPARIVSYLLPALILSAVVLPAQAAEIGLSWNPSAGAMGYNVHYGTGSRAYTVTLDAGPSNSILVVGLQDCTSYFFAVTAYNAAGESAYSNEISSLPRPRVVAADPGSAEQGQRLDVTLSGANLLGAATVRFSAPGIQINTFNAVSCTELVVDLTVGESTPSGAADIEVTSANGVQGTGSGVFGVVSSAPPTVTATDPADGATQIVTTVQPGVQFSEPVQAGTILTSTVRLLDAAGVPVAQVAGSPALSGDGRTAVISPAAELDLGATYRIEVVGGFSGVLDLVGDPMDATYLQSVGFETVPDTSTNDFAYVRFEAEAGQLEAPLALGQGVDAFGGAWIGTPAGAADGTPADPLGTSLYGVEVPTSGTWHLWLRLYGTDQTSDSWYESMDGASRNAIATSGTGAWEWVAGRSYTLTAGLHDLELGGHESGARADRILLTDDPAFVPTGQPGADTLPTEGLLGFSVTPGDGLNQLAWTNPPDGDLERAVIRYRTDGRYPVSPADGFPVLDSDAAPGDSGNHAHAGLANGQSYHYSGFAIDSSGNVSARAEATGTPGTALQPPEAPTGLRAH